MVLIVAGANRTVAGRAKAVDRHLLAVMQGIRQRNEAGRDLTVPSWPPPPFVVVEEPLGNLHMQIVKDLHTVWNSGQLRNIFCQPAKGLVIEGARKLVQFAFLRDAEPGLLPAVLALAQAVQGGLVEEAALLDEGGAAPVVLYPRLCVHEAHVRPGAHVTRKMGISLTVRRVVHADDPRVVVYVRTVGRLQQVPRRPNHSAGRPRVEAASLTPRRFPDPTFRIFTEPLGDEHAGAAFGHTDIA
mmetsp:Transcript_95538/g.270079  ORF Transcript_95538/g.270079 Transcript_95538/m.270079 type:complete len:243 (+) Transcript_95538:227-955(+)